MGGEVYVEETERSRSLGQRAEEHDKSIAKGDEKSALKSNQVRTGYAVANTLIIASSRIEFCIRYWYVILAHVYPPYSDHNRNYGVVIFFLK